MTTVTAATLNSAWEAISGQPTATLSAASLALYTSELASNTLTLPQVYAALESDPFVQTYTDPIIRLYQAAFGRLPDTAGLDGWVGQVSAGATTFSQLVTLCANSPEFAARYGGVTGSSPINTAVITAFYLNFLNRTPSAAEVNAWVSSGQTVASVLAQTVVGAEFIADTAAGVSAYQSILAAGNTPPAGSTIFTLANQPTSNYTLTTGVDASGTGAFANGQPAGNSTIYGTVNNGTGTTFSSGDNITATGLNNTLNLSDGGTGGASYIVGSVAATVSGVQNLVINSSEAITFNATTATAGYTGLTQLTATTSGAGAFTDAITAAATTNIKVTDGATAATGALTIDGGLAVTLTETNTDGGAAKLLSNISIGGTTAPAGAVAVTATETVSNAASAPGNITVSGALGVTVNSTVNDGTATGLTAAISPTAPPLAGAAGTITVTAGAGAVVVNDATVANAIVANTHLAGSFADAVAVTGGTTVTVNETVASNQAATSLSAVTEGDVSVTGTASTTAVTVNQAAVAAGSIVVAAAPAITGVNLVSPVTASPGVQGVAAVAAVNGGNSVAAVVAVAGTPQVLADGAVTIADAKNTSTATSTITSVTLANYGNSTFTGAALNSLSLSGTAGTLSIGNGAASATNTTLALAVNNLSGTNTVTDTNHEITTLNVTTGATKSSLVEFSDSGLKTLNVAGSSVLTLGSVASETVLATVAVTGAAGLTANLSGLGATLTSITTTSSGVMTLTLDDTTQTFVGSTGQDIISLAGNATKAITGGSATNNEVVLTSASGTYTAAKFGANVTGFTTLGVNDTTAADVNTYDLHNIFTGYNAIDLQSANTGAQTFTGVAAGTTLAIDAAETSVGYVLYTPSSTASVNVALNVATATTPITVGTLTLNDSNGDGLATANIVSNTKVAAPAGGTGITNIITTLADTSLSALNISGNAALQIGTVSLGQPGQAVPVGVAALAISNTSTAFNNTGTTQQASTIVNLIDDTLGSLTLSGTNGLAITTLTDNNAVNVTIGNTSTGALTIGTLIGDGNLNAASHTGLSNMTFTGSGAITISAVELVADTAALSYTNSGTGTVSIVSVQDYDTIAHIGVGGAQNLVGATSLTLSGNVAFGANGGTVAADAAGAVVFANTTGVTVAAGTDNAHISISLTGAAAAATDAITLGNANDYIKDGSTAGTVNLSVGTGSNYIDLSAGSASTYHANVTLGAHTGVDQIAVGAVAASAVLQNTMITGALKGDVLTLHDGALAAVTTLTAAQLTTAAAASNLGNAISTADLGLATHNAAAFVYGGNTYVIENGAASAGTGALAAGDTLVELVGVHTLSSTVVAHGFSLLS